MFHTKMERITTLEGGKSICVEDKRNLRNWTERITFQPLQSGAGSVESIDRRPNKAFVRASPYTYEVGGVVLDGQRNLLSVQGGASRVLKVEYPDGLVLVEKHFLIRRPKNDSDLNAEIYYIMAGLRSALRVGKYLPRFKAGFESVDHKFISAVLLMEKADSDTFDILNDPFRMDVSKVAGDLILWLKEVMDEMVRNDTTNLDMKLENIATSICNDGRNEFVLIDFDTFGMQLGSTSTYFLFPVSEVSEDDHKLRMAQTIYSTAFTAYVAALMTNAKRMLPSTFSSIDQGINALSFSRLRESTGMKDYAEMYRFGIDMMKFSIEAIKDLAFSDNVKEALQFFFDLLLRMMRAMYRFCKTKRDELALRSGPASVDETVKMFSNDPHLIESLQRLIDSVIDTRKRSATVGTMDYTSFPKKLKL